MPRPAVLALSLLLIPAAVGRADLRAQPSPRAPGARTLAGTVVDVTTGAPIADAVVAALTGEPVVTDAEGRFVLTAVAGGAATLLVSAPGYRERTVRVADGARITLAPVEASEVIELEDRAPDLGRAASWQLEVDQIRSLPGAGNDVLRAAQSLPGVARVPFGLGGLIVRGTSPRDTNVFLDGIEVPLAFHFFGITSFYPSTLLDTLAITNGGYGVEHGRGQGGLVTLTSRAPRRDGWRAGGEVSLVDASARAEGPTGRHGAISLGVRRSYIDGILRAVLPEDERLLPRYYDAQVRWDAGDVRGPGALTLWLFTSDDRLAADDSAFSEAFVRFGARYRVQRGRTTVAITPWAGRDRLAFEDAGDPDLREPATELSRSSWPVGLRGAVTRDQPWGHVAAGLDLQGARYGRLAIGGVDGPDTDDMMVQRPRDQRWSADLGLWTEARYRLRGERLAITGGLRLERFGLSDQWVVDPRVLVSQQLGPGLKLRHALGLYHQPPTAADTDPELGNPALDSAFTLQASSGLEADGPAGIQLGLTAFASRGWHQAVAVTPPPGSGFDPPGDQPGSGMGAVMLELLEEQLGSFQFRDDVGGARALGVELGARKSTARAMAWLAYTLTKARRQDDPARFTGWRPYQLDQLHNLSLVGSVVLGPWRLGGRFRYVTGNPYTRVLGERPLPDGGYEEIQGPALRHRLPAYVQLDLRADRSWRRRWGTVNLFLDVQNATWRDNAEDAYWSSDRHREEYATGLPIIPMLGVEYVPLP